MRDALALIFDTFGNFDFFGPNIALVIRGSTVTICEGITSLSLMYWVLSSLLVKENCQN